HRALVAVERDELSTVIVQVATERDAEVGIVVHRLDQIGELAAILEVEESAARTCPRRRRVGAGDEVDAGRQVREEIATESLSVVGETAPTEEANRIEGLLWGAPQERIPIDGLLAGIRRDGIDPRAAGGVTVPISVDGINVPEFAGVINLFRLG